MISAQSVAEAKRLTEQQVIKIALVGVPGKAIEVKLERHRGQQVYKIDHPTRSLADFSKIVDTLDEAEASEWAS